MERKVVSIIGCGNVGEKLSTMLVAQDVPIILNLVDPDPKVNGHYLDIGHYAFIKGIHEVVVNDQDLLRGSDYVFHTAGANIPLDASRLDVVQSSVEMTDNIFRDLRFEKEPWLVVIANPVDVICSFLASMGHLNPKRICSTGTYLDKIRLDSIIRNKIDGLEKVNSMVLGEHGQSIVWSFSHSTINDRPVFECVSEDEAEEVFMEMKSMARKIKSYQGATYWGVAGCAVEVFTSIEKGSERVIPLSVSPNPYYGELLNIEPVFLSLPVRFVKQDGIQLVDLELAKNEVEGLKKSASVIQEYCSWL